MENSSILIATSTFAEHSKESLSILEKSYSKITYNKLSKKLSSRELINHATNSIGIIAGTEIYSKAILKELPSLKVISRLGVGMDNIDLNAAKDLGIKVFKTQTTPAPAVSELVLGLMIDLARKISYQNNTLKSGKWEKTMGNLLQGKVLGIIGLGSIAKSFVQLVKGFNFKILAYDLNHDKEFAIENNIKYCDLDAILNHSDIISIHLNLSDQTRLLINEEKINKMKENVILLNTSRGEILDEDALYIALKNNPLMSAGLDVFHNEPYLGPLKELSNTILTPHIASYGKEIRNKMELDAVNNLIRGLNEV